MLLAISQRQQYDKHKAPIDVLEQSYVGYFKSFGLLLLPIPNVASLVYDYFDQFPIEGIVLTGGEDIDPQWYDEKVEWPDISPLRDETEKKMLEIAVARRIPVLGLCRGMQLINVFFGGKLVKNIREEITSGHSPGKDHLVIISDEKIVAALGKGGVMMNSFLVNSFHNQAVTANTLSPQLRAWAMAEEGIIEGLYHPSLPIMGLQWHPERKSPEEGINRMLVETFVKGEMFWKR